MKLQKLFKNSNNFEIVGLFIALLFYLLIRAYIVQVTYNIMWPKLVSNTGGNTNDFKELSFYESLMIVLLFSFLFR